MKPQILCFVAAMAIGTSANTALAATTQYFDFATFTSAVGPVKVLEDFDTGVGPAPGPFSAGVPVAFDELSITYNDAPSSLQTVGVATPAQIDAASGTSINATNQLSWGEEDQFSLGSPFDGDGPAITFTFDTALTAFGFDFSDSDSTDTYEITLGGETFLLDNASSTFIGFFGFVSDVAISSFVLTQATTGGITETFALDNIVAPIPLPASIVLLLAGLGGLGSLRRFKRS
ncbi:VPLPA-CTERM sorting domain-containing protein [Puniceibacterium sediminis]|uniref:VPLPA-CTERM protein sorting domain-containing protein n=1 Tax=Puniceibacterium sediminis TaxID=1608407 RepID=A0A238W2F3_9RHOB|nr:VPLPA-CTERM sorting domain-containing protein [Puniceibacterium sediminis]SNR39879.1 VPLPA-CTERM protein sorting domain-containing protein [Puniceibacterium sediminis]